MEDSPPRSGRAHCRVWRVDAPPEEVGSMLSRMREVGRGVLLQAFASVAQPDLVALEMLAAQTISASESGATLANKPELDLLLRLAGTRQIGEALERHGYKSGRGGIYLVAASADLDHLRSLDLAEGTRLKELRRGRPRKGTRETVERAALLSCGV